MAKNKITFAGGTVENQNLPQAYLPINITMNKKGYIAKARTEPFTVPYHEQYGMYRTESFELYWLDEVVGETFFMSKRPGGTIEDSTDLRAYFLYTVSDEGGIGFKVERDDNEPPFRFRGIQLPISGAGRTDLIQLPSAYNVLSFTDTDITVEPVYEQVGALSNWGGVTVAQTRTASSQIYDGYDNDIRIAPASWRLTYSIVMYRRRQNQMNYFSFFEPKAGLRLTPALTTDTQETISNFMVADTSYD